MPQATKRYLSRPELAELLTQRGIANVTVTTLEKWKHRGYGPTCVRVGREVRYSVVTVETWIAAIENGISA